MLLTALRVLWWPYKQSYRPLYLQTYGMYLTRDMASNKHSDLITTCIFSALQPIVLGVSYICICLFMFVVFCLSPCQSVSLSVCLTLKLLLGLIGKLMTIGRLFL